jgi:hypothetical protein
VEGPRLEMPFIG